MVLTNPRTIAGAPYEVTKCSITEIHITLPTRHVREWDLFFLFFGLFWINNSCHELMCMLSTWSIIDIDHVVKCMNDMILIMMTFITPFMSQAIVYVCKPHCRHLWFIGLVDCKINLLGIARHVVPPNLPHCSPAQLAPTSSALVCVWLVKRIVASTLSCFIVTL